MTAGQYIELADSRSLAGRNGAHPVALGDMTVPQLTAAAKMLDECQERYDKLSGICGTMRGLVLTEVKLKIGHGNFTPWLAKNFKKTRKTAAEDMRVAREFCKSNPKVTFDALGRDLATTVKELDKAQIDLKHPLVREVAQWVDGRSRYQLLLDFPSERGGDTAGSRKKLTPAEEHKLFLAAALTDFDAAFEKLDALLDSDRWKAPSIKDGKLEAAIESCDRFVKSARAWVKTPKAKRTHIAAAIEEAAE